MQSTRLSPTQPPHSHLKAVFETDHHGCSALRHHRHASAFATVVLEGEYVEVHDDVPEICRRGTIVVHDAAEEHADRFLSDTRCLNIELPSESIASVRGNVALDAPALRSSVDDVLRAYYGSGCELPGAVQRLQGVLAQRFSEPPMERPRWLHRAIDDFAWAQPVPLREAAAIAGVHATHFSRAFRHHLGMTAHEYRSRARVRLASKLLLTTTASLARIALSAGFSDQSHLTRIFSQRIGLSPAGYRRTFAR